MDYHEQGLNLAGGLRYAEWRLGSSHGGSRGMELALFSSRTCPVVTEGFAAWRSGTRARQAGNKIICLLAHRLRLRRANGGVFFFEISQPPKPASKRVTE